MKTSKPLNLSDDAVRAVIAKTKTRHTIVMKPQPECYSHADWPDQPNFEPHYNKDGSLCCGVCMGKHQRLTKRDVTGIPCPYAVGDVIPVRETWAGIVKYWTDCGWEYDAWTPQSLCKPTKLYYRADKPGKPDGGWRSSTSMPSWAVRLYLRVTGVKAYRLNAITEVEAIAEGVPRDTESCDHKRRSCAEVGCMGPTHRSTFAQQWMDSRNEKSHPWSSNCWCWAIDFELTENKS